MNLSESEIAFYFPGCNNAVAHLNGRIDLHRKKRHARAVGLNKYLKIAFVKESACNIYNTCNRHLFAIKIRHVITIRVQVNRLIRPERICYYLRMDGACDTEKTERNR